MSATKNGVLTQALENVNKAISETNVRRVEAEIGIIRHTRAQIATLEKTIADSVKRINAADSEPSIVAKDLA